MTSKNQDLYNFQKQVKIQKSLENEDVIVELNVNNGQYSYDKIKIGDNYVVSEAEEPQNIIEQPFLVKGQLREYQLVGMSWLATLHSKHLNGILAGRLNFLKYRRNGTGKDDPNDFPVGPSGDREGRVGPALGRRSNQHLSQLGNRVQKMVPRF